jgi:DEAD/DEAH box helicase domain-containing protein
MVEREVDLHGPTPDCVLETIQACIEEAEGVAIAHEREFPAVSKPGISPDSLELRSELQDYFRKQYPEGLYTHQHVGIESILAGNHTVVTTQTSSGKSFVFSLPAFDALLREPEATSLFLFPQKALANDQLAKLIDIYESVLGPMPHDDMVARYDGATPTERRPGIRAGAQFVLTNPDMLHFALLQHHDKWARFFARLRYVIIDEAHTYRGIFGSSVAYILRRLRAICSHYGSAPVFISASATIADPKTHLKKLTGLEFTEIGPDLDGSSQGRKKIWFLRSQLHHYQLSRILTRRLVERDLTCLTFCPTRLSAERLLADMPESEVDDGRMRVYRAGLGSEEREEIEAGLRNGSVKGVFSTSALEIGIDIGALDAVVCVGLPNTMMSLWQRAGRVARAGKEGGIIFVAADTPLDSYFAENPDELFERDNEPLAISLQNRRLICHHLACAIHEAEDEDALRLDILGEGIKHALELHRENRLNAEVFYADDPHMQTPIRNADAKNYSLMVGDNKIGEISSWHLLREAYPKAIYLHGGSRYRVAGIARGQQIVRLHADRTHNLTTPVIKTAIRTRRVRAVTEYSHLIIKMADFDVTERLVAIQERKRSGDLVHNFTGNLGLAPHRLPTEGICIETRPELTLRLTKQITKCTIASVVGAIARLIWGLFPVVSGPCDTGDFNTFAEVKADRLRWYLYDQVHDGIDLSIQAYPKVRELLEKAVNCIRACNCADDEGCFRCVKNPDQDDIVSKAECVYVLDELVMELGKGEPRVQVFDIDTLDEEIDVHSCPKCNAEVSDADRFCSSCGEVLTR